MTDVQGDIGLPKLVEVLDGVTVQEWPEVEKELPLQSAEQAMIPNAADSGEPEQDKARAQAKGQTRFFGLKFYPRRHRLGL